MHRFMTGGPASQQQIPSLAGMTQPDKHLHPTRAPEEATVTMHDDLVQHVCVLEARDEIRQLMAAYVHARDLANIPVVDYLTEDAVWEGVGRMADILGRHTGRDAIAKRFAGPVPPGLHLLANESIAVNGDDAVGYWTYLQPMVLGGRAYWVAGRYHNDFQRGDGSWRIRHMRVEAISEAPYDHGWAQAEFFQRQAAPATG